MDNQEALTPQKLNKKSITALYRSLTPERTLLLWLLIAGSVFLFISAGLVINNRFLAIAPAYGGSFSEGIQGTVRFINPVLASTDQDRDLTLLIFAGLMKNDTSGMAVNDMAETIERSADGLTYTITIHKNALFHDGTPVTSDDILYTVGLVQNPNIKSPRRIEWEGVSAEKISDKKVQFTLKQPYPLFTQALTLGILPKHLWKSLSDEQISLSDLNIHSIGSGAYKLDSVDTKSGIPTVFHLTANKNYTVGRPFVEALKIFTYQNEKSMLQAFADGDITRIHGISLEKLEANNIATTSIKTSLLPRTFAVFFNPNNAQILTEKEIRHALNIAIDKETIVQTVLRGQGKVIQGPFPFDDEVGTSTYNPTEAKHLLESSKAFKKASTTLAITLSTANTEEMKAVAQLIKKYWEALGVSTTISVYELSDLNQSVIKDRDFQALLFGTITQTPSDLYAFWHSSQRNYPGLNISNYVSKELDTNLEIVRQSLEESERSAAYVKIKNELEDEAPGIFLFAPNLLYVTSDKVITTLPRYSMESSSRFELISTWYRYSEKIWPNTYSHPVTQFIYNLLH